MENSYGFNVPACCALTFFPAIPETKTGIELRLLEVREYEGADPLVRN